MTLIPSVQGCDIVPKGACRVCSQLHTFNHLLECCLAASAPPVPSTSPKQEHNQDDKQNRFQAHLNPPRTDLNNWRCPGTAPTGNRLSTLAFTSPF